MMLESVLLAQGSFVVSDKLSLPANGAVQPTVSIVEPVMLSGKFGEITVAFDEQLDPV